MTARMLFIFLYVFLRTVSPLNFVGVKKNNRSMV
jgi:hypothetical protein